jgi:hypothetical protein
MADLANLAARGHASNTAAPGGKQPRPSVVVVSVKLFLPPWSRRRWMACGHRSVDRNSSSPEEGLSERVEVSEPDGTPNRQKRLQRARS